MTTQSFSQFDIDKVIQLLNMCFPGKSISRKSFFWKYLDPFFKNKSIARVALDHETCASFVSFLPVFLSVFGKKRLLYSCAVVATHPNYRRRGLVSTLTLEIEKKLPPSTEYLGFSNEDGVQIDRHSKKIAYSIVGELRTAYLPIKLVSKRYSFESITAKEVHVEHIHDVQSVRLDIDSEYVDWKFLRNPKQRYQYFLVRKLEQEIGCIVCIFGSWKVTIVHCFIPTKELDRDFWKSAAHHFWIHYHKVVSVTFLDNTFWKSSLPLFSLTKAIGIYLTVKSQDKKLLSNENWFVMGGDIQ